MPEATRNKYMRKCVSCGKQSTKQSLMRIVRLADGSVAYDATGRVAGRGAYVCSEACLATALKSRKLQRALKATIQEEDARRIASQIESVRQAEMG